MNKSIAALLGVAGLASMTTAGDAWVRAVHASPDAPNVDILVNDGVAFGDVPFTAISTYAALAPDTYNFKVVPAGQTDPVVIEADLGLSADTAYTIVALNTLAKIEPLVLVDDNTLDNQAARIRFVHASPDAPAVDIALAGGGVLFGNISFKGVGDYISVPGGVYDLEVRLAGTDTVVLPLPGIGVSNKSVYTVYAMGFAGGQPGLSAQISVDAVPAPGAGAVLGLAGLLAARRRR